MDDAVGLPKGPASQDDMCKVNGPASATLLGWRWEMGIWAEGGAPCYEIAAFAYGDLKIQAFGENCGFGLIACAAAGIPFLGIAWLGLLGGTALGLGDAFCCRTRFLGLGQRDGWRWAEIHPHAALWAGSCAQNDQRGANRSVRLSASKESKLRLEHAKQRF